MGEVYEIAVEMDSLVMICTPIFMKIGSGIQKLMGVDSQKNRQHSDLISLLSFSSKQRKQRNKLYIFR
jgi:hypothetical protein